MASSGWKSVLDGNVIVVQVKASLRWWTILGDYNHVKGDVVLERFTAAETALFRLVFKGTRVKESSEVVDSIHGALYLPIECAMEIDRSLLESKHSCAHGIRISFGSNKDGLLRLQLIIPTNDAATNVAGMLFGEALEHAEVERRRFYTTTSEP